MRQHIESALGRHLFTLLWHQGRLLRTQLHRKLRDARFAGHLQVEVHLTRLAQHPYIAILHVTPVFPKVDRDQIRPAQFRQGRRPDRVGLNRPPGLTNRRHMINVPTQSRHGVPLRPVLVSLPHSQWSWEQIP